MGSGFIMAFKNKDENLLVILFVLLFAVVLLRTAWVCDDAYITFRTIDNFVHGHGLTWNTAERVQAYTNPLWMFLLTPLYSLTQEILYSSQLLSIGVSLLAVLLFALRIARSSTAALLGITILTFSKAFVDYSTSGLENPMTHLVLAAFLLVYLESKTNLRTLFLLSLIAAIGTLNRMDTILLFLPALAYAFFELHRRKGLSAVLLGFLPFILWECFSLFYYGTPFPNPFYAKLNTGIPGSQLAQQGLYYFLNSISMDPLSLLIIASGITTPFLTKEWRNLPVAVGIGLYLLYVVKIGGDFMSGRFFAAPLFCAVVLLSRCHFMSLRSTGLPALLAVVLVGLSSPYPPLLSDAQYGLKHTQLMDDKGISDERGYYYQYTGLLKARRNIEVPNHPWAVEGRQARTKGPSVVRRGGIGFFGFYAGPKVHVVDPAALADPLLARLPAKRNPDWRIGHFRRQIPDHYLRTLDSGRNAMTDSNLAAYYDKLSLITRGEMVDMRRLIEIWNMNVGKYNHLIDFDFYRYPSMLHVDLSEIDKPKAEGTPADQEGNIVLSNSGIEINLGKQYHTGRIEIGLDHDDNYQIIYFHEDRELASQTIWARPIPRGGLAIHFVDVPAEAVRKGYDRVRILPLRGHGKYSIGYMRLVE